MAPGDSRVAMPTNSVAAHYSFLIPPTLRENWKVDHAPRPAHLPRTLARGEDDVASFLTHFLATPRRLVDHGGLKVVEPQLQKA
jgi:hypothetical protein